MSTGPERLGATLRQTFLITILLAVSSLLAAAETKSSNEKLEQLWADLEKAEPHASSAVLALANTPEMSIPFLRGKLKPVSLTIEQAKALLKALGSDDETQWASAYEELEYLDPRLAIDLETLMDKIDESSARQRMVEILSSREAGSLAGKEITLYHSHKGYYNFRAERGSWWAEPDVSSLNAERHSPRKRKWTRAVRAIALLQHFGTPEALAILTEMASGHPDAQPTRVAKNAIRTIKYGSFD